MIAATVALAALAALSQSEPPKPDDVPAVLRLINAARTRSGAVPLLENSLLDRVAQASAERVAGARSLSEAEDASRDVGKRVTAAGYEHRRVEEIVLTGDGAFADRLARLRESDPETFAEVVHPDYRDLGVGMAEGAAGTVRVFVFGLSLSDEFARRAEALRDLSAVRADMLARVNEARRARRLPPLRENALLDEAAQGHATDMVRRSYYSHDSPEGATAMERARRAGYVAAAVGENIAEGQPTVAEVMDGWMKSPTHRRHILSLDLEEIGIGVAFGKNARGFEIVWVQVFGTPR